MHVSENELASITGKCFSKPATILLTQYSPYLSLARR